MIAGVVDGLSVMPSTGMNPDNKKIIIASNQAGRVSKITMAQTASICFITSDYNRGGD